MTISATQLMTRVRMWLLVAALTALVARVPMPRPYVMPGEQP
jgi:hypothetical protein